jgi:hypothetical protein
VVVATAEQSPRTRAFDESYRASVLDYLDSRTRGETDDREFPLTGAEALMSGIVLLRADRAMAPHGVVRSMGGDQSPWKVVWTSPDWVPDRVLVTGGGLPLVQLRVVTT